MLDILPEDVSPNVAISYFTKYYYDKLKSNITDNKLLLSSIINNVIDKMNSYNLNVTYYQEYIAKDRIEKYFKDLYTGKLSLLRDINTIPLYKSEYETILRCDSDREKKILFTMYILARLVNGHGWVYQSDTDIYKLANVSTTNKNDNVFYLLNTKGFITVPKKIGSKMKVELSEILNEPIEIEIDDISNLGNKFIAHMKTGYIVCKGCGKLVKIKSKHDYSTKYCKGCIVKKENENATLRKRKQRETQKCHGSLMVENPL